MEINFDKLEADLKEYFKTDEIRSEKSLDGFSKAIIFALKQYHEELTKTYKPESKEK